MSIWPLFRRNEAPPPIRPLPEFPNEGAPADQVLDYSAMRFMTGFCVRDEYVQRAIAAYREKWPATDNHGGPT